MKINTVSAGLIVPAAGLSSRMGGNIKKEFLPLSGCQGTVLAAAIEPFLSAVPLSIIIVTVQAGGGDSAKSAAYQALSMSPVVHQWLTKLHPGERKYFYTAQNDNIPCLLLTEGGATRQQSVYKALQQMAQYKPDIVLIHDGARPYVTKDIIQGVYYKACEKNAATCAISPVDTQKEIDGSGMIIRHLNRDRLVAVQTPQGFRFQPLLEAHQKAAADGCTYTDDTEIWSKYVSPVYITGGSVENKKITFTQDIPGKAETVMTIKTGLGYDRHRLVTGRKLRIGGIIIPSEKGEDGHSDGDVLLHAITDALLGAAAMGDIGSFFPPSEPERKDADSRELLRIVWKQITDAGWQLGNIDCVIALETPKLLPFREEICKSIRTILGTDDSSVFVKAKTGEKLGPVGTGEAVEAWATCLLHK